MKIGYVFDDSLDRPDGVQQYLSTLGEWERTRGHEVHYLVGDTEGDQLQNIHSLSRTWEVAFNGNRLSVPLPVRKQKAAHLLGQLQLDLLHVQMPYSPWMAGQLIDVASPQTAVVGTFHIMPSGWLSRVGTRLAAIPERRALRRFDAIMACSQPAQAFAKENYGVDSQVVPNPVNLSHFRRAEKAEVSDVPTIVFLGRLVRRKGCQHLLEAVQELKSRSGAPKFLVRIGGRGPFEQRLREQVADYNLGETVQFNGFINEIDKPDYLAHADIAAFPSTGGESFGIILTEAMASGAGVVLAGNNPGYASVLADPEMLIDPTNVKTFADKLENLLMDAALARKLHVKQQALVKQFDIETVGPKIEDIYLRALHTRQSMR